MSPCRLLVVECEETEWKIWGSDTWAQEFKGEEVQAPEARSMAGRKGLA